MSAFNTSLQIPVSIVTTGSLAAAAVADLVLYVSSTGSDTANDGRTSCAPFATLQHALDEGARIGYLESLTVTLLTSLALGTDPSLYVSPTPRPQSSNNIFLRGVTTTQASAQSVTSTGLWGPKTWGGTKQFPYLAATGLGSTYAKAVGSYIIDDAAAADDVAYVTTRNPNEDWHELSGGAEDVVLLMCDSDFAPATITTVTNAVNLSFNGQLSVRGLFDAFTFRYLNIDLGDTTISASNVASLYTLDPSQTLTFVNCQLTMKTDPEPAPYRALPGNTKLLGCKISRKTGTGNDFPLVFGTPETRGAKCTVSECALHQPVEIHCAVSMRRCYGDRQAMFAAPDTDAFMLLNNCDSADIAGLALSAAGVTGAVKPMFQASATTLSIRNSGLSGGEEVCEGMDVRNNSRVELGGRVELKRFSGTSGASLTVRGASTVTNDSKRNTILNTNGSTSLTEHVNISGGSTFSFSEDAIESISADIAGANGGNGIVMGPLSSFFFDNGAVVPTLNAAGADVVLPSGAIRTFAQVRARAAITDYSEAQSAGQLFGTMIIM